MAGETTLAKLVSRDTWQSYWRPYSENGKVFDYDPERHLVIVEGGGGGG